METQLSFAKMLGEEFDAADQARHPIPQVERDHANRILRRWNEAVRDRLKPFSYEQL
jgi:hypothetical protein